MQICKSQDSPEISFLYSSPLMCISDKALWITTLFPAPDNRPYHCTNICLYPVIRGKAINAWCIPCPSLLVYGVFFRECQQQVAVLWPSCGPPMSPLNLTPVPGDALAKREHPVCVNPVKIQAGTDEPSTLYSLYTENADFLWPMCMWLLGE